MLTPEQLADYQANGYLVLRGAIDEGDLERLERGLERNPPLDGTLDPDAPAYPAPGRYTLANQCLKDPDLAFIVGHPTIVSSVTDILGEAPRLTAYVIYDRTPGGPGLPAHHDYKRWRPVGSSMHWLFTIVPFCDYDEDTGPLYVAPGSHRPERVRTGTGPCLEVAPAMRPADEDFVDPGLERGDLLLMNMHLWHRASPNRSGVHRAGLFNKYAAASFPPATGYFLYDEDVFAALPPEAQPLIAVHSNREIMTTRAVLTRERQRRQELLLRDAGTVLALPGGVVSEERAIPDWDRGNYIASLQQHLREQLAIETPWLSYIGDYEEGDGLCRVYGYTLNDNGFPVPYEGIWQPLDAVDEETLALGWELEAVRRWQDPVITRGKGVSQAQARIDQFAY